MYKGQLQGFPTEVVEKMLEYQVAQRNKRDISVFERERVANNTNGGFGWGHTAEGYDFWASVVEERNFKVFFDRYPAKKAEYPKVMMVSKEEVRWLKRVVFMEKNNQYLAWDSATNIEDAENTNAVNGWKYAKEIEEPKLVELTMKDISEGKGVGVPPELIRIKE